MITEDYCSYDIAKLLKEKGFNEQCRNYYVKEHDKWIHRNTYEYNYFNLDVPRWEACYACPTYQMAIKWLREEKNLIINVWYDGADWNAEYYNDEDEKFCLITCLCNSYEDAVEAALKYCLENLI